MDQPIVSLASDFPQPLPEAWLALVKQTLHGEAFDRLISRTYDGLPVQPLYTAKDAAALPDELRPPVRSAGQPSWDVRTLVDHPDPAGANRQALDDLEGGASSILLRLDLSGVNGTAAASAADISRVLAGVELELATVALDAGFMGPLAAEGLDQTAKASPRAKLAFHLDPVSAFAEAGRSPGAIEHHLSEAGAAASRLVSVYPEASLFLASGRVVHEAGGGEAQELGFVTASALAYAKALTGAGVSLPDAFARVTLGLSADAEYFITAAKFRAARAIWSRLTSACQIDAPVRIEARNSRRMLSKLDPWVNLLRITAAGFAGVVGGADAMVLDPFTQPLGRASPFARRQARNTQLILMEEGQIGRVADPAGGAWSVETLTLQLARGGWAVFQSIERQGGIVAALTNGFVAEDVARTRALREADIAHRVRSLVGVSAFPSLIEAGVEVEQIDPAPFAKRCSHTAANGSDSVCRPLTAYRDSEPFERLRSVVSAMTASPTVFLATLGTAAEHAGRTGFARSLASAGGMSVIVGEPVDYTRDAASTVILCGPDRLYGLDGARAAAQLKAAGARLVYVAGKPGELEALLREAGVDGFIFTGSDAVTALQRMIEAAA